MNNDGLESTTIILCDHRGRKVFFGPKIKFRFKTKGCHDQQKRIPKYKTKVCKLPRNLKTDDNLMAELLLFNSYIR